MVTVDRLSGSVELKLVIKQTAVIDRGNKQRKERRRDGQRERHGDGLLKRHWSPEVKSDKEQVKESVRGVVGCSRGVEESQTSIRVADVSLAESRPLLVRGQQKQDAAPRLDHPGVDHGL